MIEKLQGSVIDVISKGYICTYIARLWLWGIEVTSRRCTQLENECRLGMFDISNRLMQGGRRDLLISMAT